MSFRQLLIGVSLLLLTLLAVFGLLNQSKLKSLRAQDAPAAQRATTQSTAATSPGTSVRSAETEARAAEAEAELLKSETERANLESQLQAKQNEVAQLQKRIEELAPDSTRAESSPAPSVAELQAQPEETHKELDHAEREKSLLSEKIRGGQEHSSGGIEQRTQSLRVIVQPGVHGTVLAVNRAYNFVVLNLGGRQGVEVNSEMLVVRGTTLIGRIRISSVEPATAIGDIISSSLPRGVQVQLGDTVIYAGNDS